MKKKCSLTPVYTVLLSLSLTLTPESVVLAKEIKEKNFLRKNGPHNQKYLVTSKLQGDKLDFF